MLERVSCEWSTRKDIIVKPLNKLGIRTFLNHFCTGVMLIRSFFAHIITCGLNETVMLTRERISGIWNDWRLGIKTCEMVMSSELDFDNPSNQSYAVISYQTLHKESAEKVFSLPNLSLS